MQAVILVGGEGTRLRPLTYGTPKPMVPLFGVPILERTLSRLSHAGIDHVILAAGYLPAAIERHFGDGSRLGMRITYVVEREPLGTAGAIRNVAEHIVGPFFVLNGDVLTSLDLQAMIAEHEAKRGVGVLHAIRVDDPSAFGCIVRDGDGRISRFVEKPPRDEAPTDEINAGTYLLEPSVLDLIPAGRNVSIEREVFPQLLASGAALYSYATSDYWLDLGRPDQYLQAHYDVLSGKTSLGPSADPTQRLGSMFGSMASAPSGIVPAVFIGNGVAIDERATIGPLATIGDGSAIGRDARVRGSVLWDGVVIGEGAEIAGAIIASNARIGAGAVIDAGAVIGHGVEVAAGAHVTSDARLAASAR